MSQCFDAYAMSRYARFDVADAQRLLMLFDMFQRAAHLPFAAMRQRFDAVRASY